MLFFCTTDEAVGTLLLGLASLTLSLSAGAQTAEKAQRDAERARITAERQAVAQRLSEQETACYQRFAVEDCLRKVRSQARAEDNALRRQALEINDRERREKSEQRLRSSEQNMQEPRSKAPVEGKLRSPKAVSAPKPAGDAQDRAHTLRAQQARERAQAQNEHQQSRATELARKQASEAERRAAARERYEAKQLSAQQRRQRAKAQEDGKPKALPLPAVDH